MRFFHLADLHLGRSLHNVSLLEDQRHILLQVMEQVQGHQPDALLVSGDVYDKAQPSAGSVDLFDAFLTELVRANLPTFIISGNHDSPERLDFGSRIFQSSNVHVCGVFPGSVPRVTLHDLGGEVDFYLLPFVKPSLVRHVFPQETLEDCADAVRAALASTPVNPQRRSVLLAHQFVAGAGVAPERSESEQQYAGGLDAVPPALFHAFDYVALGHLHGAQKVGSERIRYAGSPLKYSFSEILQQKSISVVELDSAKAEDGKAQLSISAIPLTPLHDVRRLKGPFADLTAPQNLQEGDPNDYMQIILTDEDEVPDAMRRLKNVYPNVLELRFDNARTRAEADFSQDVDADAQSPQELFEAFFLEQNGREPTMLQRDAVQRLLNGQDAS